MARVTFRRYQTKTEAEASDIVDGQLIVTKDGKSYVDYGSTRVPFGGTLDAAMSDSSLNGVQNKTIKEYVDTKSTADQTYTDTKINTVKPYVLYNVSGGSNGTITLSDSAANYSYIEIFFKSGDGGYSSVKVADPNTKNVPLIIFWTGGYTSSYQAVYMDTRTVAINGTSISTLDTRYYHQAIKYNNTLGEYSHANNIYIEKVVGYK